MTRQAQPAREHPPHAARSLWPDVLALVCAFSAGVHAALAPEHLEEAPVIGGAFIPAAVLAAAVALALLLWPQSVWPARAAALLLLGMIVAYVVAVAFAVPGVRGTPEAVETIALVTKGVELIGLAIAAPLSLRRSSEANSLIRPGTPRSTC